MSQRRRQEGKTTAAPSHHTPQRRHATPPSMPRIVIAPTAVVRTMAFLTASSRARLMHADPHAGETCAMYVVLRFATRLRDDVQRDADPILGAWLPEDVEGGACEFDDLAESLLDCGVVPQQLMVDDAEPLKRLLLDAVAGAPVVRVPCRRTMGFARWFWRLVRVTFQPCCTSVNIAVAGVGSTQLTFFHACVSDPDGSSSQLASRRHWIQPRTWTFEADKSPHLAAAEGHTPCLMVLQRLGVDLHAHAADNPYSLATPARFAAAAGKPQSLRFLISDAREKEDTPQLLTVCAEGDHVDCIEVLVAEGADLRVSGQQLFAKAVECNSCAVVKKCLVGWNCADPFLMDPCGTDSICTAALYGHATVLEALRDANVDLLAGKYNSSHDVLTAAVRGGDAKSVALVASVKGASRRLNFAAALNLAAEIDAPNLFSTLVGLLNDDAGADARAECLRHVTLRPVFGLPQFSLTLLRTLMEGGVDPNAALDQHGSTALHRLAKSDTPAVSAGMKLLLQHGAHVDARDAFGCTPLHYVAREDHETIIGLLHTAGCDVNARDVEGQTPLHYAAKQCHFRCVSRLARCGADVRALDNQNRSLLWFAAQSGDIATVKLAVSAGLNVHARNGTGMSVVCAAVSSANGYRALRALSDAGASFTQPFPDGSLPLDVFKSNAQYDPEMAAVLRSLPASLWRAGVVKKTSR